MSAKVLARELGVVIRCNADGCTAVHRTANVRVKVNRAEAKRNGWIRGGRRQGSKVVKLADGTRKVVPETKWSKAMDMCPEHAPAELAWRVATDKATAEKRAARGAKRKPAPA